MKKIVKCIVADEYITGDGVSLGAAGSYNDVLLELTFSPMWEGAEKQVVWKDAHGGNKTTQPLTEEMRVDGTNTYRVPVPATAKQVEGVCSMYVTGTVTVDGEVVSCTTTERAYFLVLPSL